MTIRLTPEQAARLGITAAGTRRRSTRKEATGRWHTRCTVCGVGCHGETQEARHNKQYGHRRFEVVL